MVFGSFTISLTPNITGNKISKYTNYDNFVNFLLQYNFTLEELKKIRVSNFITADTHFLNKNYLIKISYFSSDIAIKIYQFLFLQKLSNKNIILGDINFSILNLYMNNKYSAKQELEDIEFIDYEKKNIILKIRTPFFYKIGSKYQSILDKNYFFKSLLKQINLYYDKDLLNINLETINKINMYLENIRELPTIFNSKGVIGNIVFNLENLTVVEIKIVKFVLALTRFTGVGYLTKKGYGEVEVNSSDIFIEYGE